jgi:hypothetical protein
MRDAARRSAAFPAKASVYHGEVSADGTKQGPCRCRIVFDRMMGRRCVFPQALPLPTFVADLLEKASGSVFARVGDDPGAGGVVALRLRM